MNTRALALIPYLMPNPALREKVGLLRLVVGGPAHGQVRSSTTGWALDAIQASDRLITKVAPGVTDEKVTFTRIRYYAEEVAFAGRSWRTWRLDGVTEVEHVAAAMHALVQTVHELDVRVPLLQSGQDAVDSNL
jgi:hypothetical protein